jgi:hypothetical protein
MSEYVSVKDLPQAIQSALDSVGYGRKDIAVDVKTSVQLSGSAGNGRQSFATLVNLSSGTYHTEMGSWGGQNMFDRKNAVDNDNRTFPLPANGVAIVGVRGGNQPVWAHMYIPAAMVAKILPGKGESVTDQEASILGAFKSLKSGDYRKESLRKAGCTEEILDNLAKRGLLKRSRNSATQITTAGKNLAGGYR